MRPFSMVGRPPSPFGELFPDHFQEERRSSVACSAAIDLAESRLSKRKRFSRINGELGLSSSPLSFISLSIRPGLHFSYGLRGR